MSKIEQTVAGIAPVDRSLLGAVSAHLDNLTKPPGSLGRLEEIAAQYCLMTGTADPLLGPKRIYVFAGDHGVSAKRVSAFPKEVTVQMVLNMLRGGAAINVLARNAGADVRVVDMGVDGTFENAEGLIDRKVRPGTADISEGPAMTREEAMRAVTVGIELAREAHAEGIALLGTGEMGIANTTASAAVMAALLPCTPEEIVGRGTGIDDATLENKIQLVRKALSANGDRLGDPMDVLASVGGLEIAGIAGLVLGGAALKIPVVVDGFVTSAGALVACRMAPSVKDYIFFSHLSAEMGHRKFFAEMEARPLLDFGLRLGEGTGAAVAMPIIEAAIKIYREMATFETAGVSGKDA